jgi:hypothetical protein
MVCARTHNFARLVGHGKQISVPDQEGSRTKLLPRSEYDVRWVRLCLIPLNQARHYIIDANSVEFNSLLAFCNDAVRRTLFMRTSLSILACILGAASAVLMPTPTGRFGVGVREYMLKKYTSNDPTRKFGGGSEILVSVYYPTIAKTTERQQYFDPTSAHIYEKAWKFPDGSLQTLETLLQPDAPFLDPNDEPSSLPTLVFSPGGGVNGYMYYTIVGNLASIGYPVVVIDHPGENPATQLPNGTTILGLNINFAWQVALNLILL